MESSSSAFACQIAACRIRPIVTKPIITKMEKKMASSDSTASRDPDANVNHMDTEEIDQSGEGGGIGEASLHVEARRLT